MEQPLPEYVVTDDEYSEWLAHYGTPRHSGRYPWGSGENPYQSALNYYMHVKGLRSKGLSDKDIAQGMGMTIRQMKARYSNAKNEKKLEEYRKALKLSEKGYSNEAIARELGYAGESSVRSLLDKNRKDRNLRTTNTANALEEAIKNQGPIDISSGVEDYLGVSATMKDNAVAMLEDRGYKVFNLYTRQQGTGKDTTRKVIAPPGSEFKEVIKQNAHISPPGLYSNDDFGRDIVAVKKPVNLDSKRIKINYNEDGGVLKDGVIELRRGVPDLSLGKANYAQVRIAVDGTHYLKGMAMYSDNLPEGVDVMFNTNKHRGTPMTDVLKPLKIDKATGKIDEFNPFGASIKNGEKLVKAQIDYIDKDGKKKQSPINIVNEEGDWGNWSKTLSSQFLSKQPVDVAKKQLDKSYSSSKARFDDLDKLTNSVVRSKMLMDFAESCDSAAVHLKAAAMPRQASHVILPFPKMKDNEIYAPGYRNGEEVMLVRHPHAGRFEIPTLRVNNNIKEAKNVIGNSRDAVGINHKVAAQLSGADFDGDSVLVIPTRGTGLKASKPLKGLANFDPTEAYGMPEKDWNKKYPKFQKQLEMGTISNLITDMTIKGASESEIARAVRHSMVIIDTEKHKLDYKASYLDNGISELKKKYQVKENGKTGGASTLISRAKSTDYVNTFRERLNPKTGMYERFYTNKTFDKKHISPTGEVTYTKEYRKTKLTKMGNTADARKLSSGSPIEEVYARYANDMKALARESRIKAGQGTYKYSPTAAKAYATEVARLNEALRIARMNAPRERKAQAMANERVRMQLGAHPDLKDDPDFVKRLKNQALEVCRERYGAKKEQIVISDKEWEAIQAGAITKTKLSEIIKNTNEDRLTELATPRYKAAANPSTIARAKSMAVNGATLAEIADAMGLSTSTVSKLLDD